MKLNHTTYSASFTAGGLLYRETTCLLPLLFSEHPDKLIQEEIINNDLLKINSEASRKRVIWEINKRMAHMNDDFRRFYTEKCVYEQKLLLFYVCLKTYKLMFDLHFNVTVKRWNSSSHRIEPYFYRMELNELSVRNQQVNGWSDLTKSKLVSVYLKILKEIGLLVAANQTPLSASEQKISGADTTDHTLSPVTASNDFWRFFVQCNESWFLDACLLSVRQKQFM